MSPVILFSLVIVYFLLLLGVAWFTSRNANNESFFIGNRGSNWMLVAFGMIGTSLSGVTFVSVPGTVGIESFTYFQIVIGNLVGYGVVAFVLLPIYYRLQLTSIYNYLQGRLGFLSYKTGASFFILSRTLGATARLYLVVNVLHLTILQDFGMPFWVGAFVILLMILLYTFEGGVKTIVWTDMLQTACMLIGLVVCVVYILSDLGLSLEAGTKALADKGYSNIFITDPASKYFFVKQIVAGAFISITMTGMDQEMMQKNISVRTLKDSQKNMMTFAVIFMLVVLLFLFLGGLLHLFAESKGIAARGDALFPTIALEYMPGAVSIIFIIALISALFPSADGAITALTSSFCIDILGIQRDASLDDKKRKRIRQIVHLVFAAVFLLFVMAFKWMNNPSMIGLILKIAGYTYGPLLGLFAFGILTKRTVNDKLVPLVVIAAPAICFIIDAYQQHIFGGFQIGLELLFINGLLTFLGLCMIPARKVQP
ncbi:sodium:solute symporter [Chitinophaga sp. XS-30]|uniref:sodium:solute symporter n=1 Tax=Chitinophaga sp. XS-30 TaxID=2604421 RepID=UPI0011DCB7CC|nr:sodium:solute symporter [Chitinophaga sp. XS-30]QEH41622.1 sodium:solute symporter [Chitinophaga sp. XS-30]